MKAKNQRLQRFFPLYLIKEIEGPVKLNWNKICLMFVLGKICINFVIVCGATNFIKGEEVEILFNVRQFSKKNSHT